jgi:autotransporter-associated beta strand protein
LEIQGTINSPVPVIVRDGTVMFSGGGTYADLTVTAGTAMVGASNGICTTAVVNLGTDAEATLDLNGFNQQLAGLTRTSANTVTVTNSGVSSVLTIDTTGAPSYPGDVSGALSLVKSGSGTQTISGDVSYSGDTTVSAGILSLAAANASNEASMVNIGASATLNLTFAGTDTVDKLFVGGIQKSPGVYEAIGNPGSGIEIAQITGSGTLTVTSGPSLGTDYAGWSATNAPGQTPDLDYDNDGVENGIEYFMGLSSPGFTANPGLIANTITWPKSATFSGSYVVQTSGNLKNWTNVTATDSGSSVSYTLPAGQEKLFVRISVDPN